jgi:recombination protein RecR
MKYSPLLDELITSFQKLPGVGPKSAQRLAFHILERQPKVGLKLSEALHAAVTRVGQCRQCRNFTEEALCSLCVNPERYRDRQICIVESPTDLVALETSGFYNGHYFILHGLLSPLDNMGPEEIGLHDLEQVLVDKRYDEVILATNPSIEGEITANFILNIAKRYEIKITRIAHGVPVGGELEYVDSTTLALSLQGRRSLNQT